MLLVSYFSVLIPEPCRLAEIVDTSIFFLKFCVELGTEKKRARGEGSCHKPKNALYCNNEQCNLQGGCFLHFCLVGKAVRVEDSPMPTIFMPWCHSGSGAFHETYLRPNPDPNKEINPKPKT